MKDFFRILSYSNKLTSRLIQFFGFSILGTVFSAVTLLVAIPMLDILFDKVQSSTVTPPLPDFELTAGYLENLFKHYFISIINEYGKADALLFICACITASALLGNIFRYLERVFASKLKVNMVRNLRKEIFDKVTRLHIGYFNDQRKGDLISRFTNDVQEVETAVVNSLKVVFKEPITIIVYFGLMFIISTKLTLFTIIVLPLVGGVLAEIVKRLKRQAKESQESLGRTVNILDETFSGMRVVKAFNARKYIMGKIEEENEYYGKVNFSMAKKNEISGPVSESFGVLIIAGIMYFGGNLILNGEGELKASEFITFLAFFAQIIPPAKSFSNGVTSLQKGIASARRIFTVIDTEPVIENKPNAIILQQFEKNVEFKNVSFAYETEHVLKNVNLTVEKGKT